MSTASYTTQDSQSECLRPAPNIETRTYVRGAPADNVSADAIITVIVDIESQIKVLNDMKTTSRTVSYKIKMLNDDIDKLVAIMDADFASSEDDTTS